MDKLIESKIDAALLRSKELLVNTMGSDKEMFNTLAKLARASNEGSRLGHVLSKVNDHCRKRWNKWRVMFMNNYLSSLWVFISLPPSCYIVIQILVGDWWNLGLAH